MVKILLCDDCHCYRPTRFFHSSWDDPLAFQCDYCKGYIKGEKIKLEESVKDYREAKTDKESFSLTEIPFESLVRLGRVFKEGHGKYGRGNWRKGVGNKEYQLERCNHAIKHLMIYAQWLETGEYVGDVLYKEDEIAKVMWFCATQIELERLERESNGSYSGKSR